MCISPNKKSMNLIGLHVLYRIKLESLYARRRVFFVKYRRSYILNNSSSLTASMEKKMIHLYKKFIISQNFLQGTVLP